MRSSVSSRIRAISAFDHSRTAATSSSARRREVGGLDGRSGVDLLDHGLRFGLTGGPSSRRARLGGGLHGATEIGHELSSARRVGRRGSRRSVMRSRRLGLSLGLGIGGSHRSAGSSRSLATRSGGLIDRAGLWSASPALDRLGRRASRPLPSTGSLKPGRGVGMCAMRVAVLVSWDVGLGRPDIRGCGGIVAARVGTVQLTSGTSGPDPVVPPGSAATARATMGRMDATSRLRRPTRTDRHARPGDARPAHLGHRPLQLPLHLLHAQGGLRADYAFLPRDQVLSFEEIERRRPDLRRARRREAADHRRRAARPARSARPDRDARRAPTTRRRRARPDADDQRLGAARAGRPLAEAGLQRVTVSLDSLDDAVFGAMNGIDFPVARVLDGIDAASRRASSRSRSTWSSGAAINESSIVADGALGARDGRDPAVHRVHGRRPLERLAARRGGPGRRSWSRRIGGGLADRAGRRRPTAARSPDRWRYARRRRRVRGDLVGDPAVLRRLHARADLGRGQALHVPVRGRRATTSGRSLRVGATDAELADVIDRHLDAPRRPLLRARSAATVDAARRSRCSRWAAEPASVVHRLIHSHVTIGGQRRTESARTSWITALTVAPAGP